ncbi:prepilin peptidase [Saccharothrix texasensis]|uniref:Leader peptidase (Prepilin peptidase)/N-methyltransferase n=1 Tax=Saccharothrix texasensis TaxID=103734 RepID=A0A3N1H474_9PSEU|nr:prepilin peptidase [Saccharothrix texasensis]ROP37298.1 leader peptidase (prepilin peptidase)/N-methyltransferase [Saccharothrix texasensis]
MNGVLLPLWAGVGLLTGALLAIPVRRLLGSRPTAIFFLAWALPALTAAAFAVLAWRFGERFDLLPFSVLAAGGVPLGAVDGLERRLPSRLLLPTAAVVGSLLLASAMADSQPTRLLHALAGMTILALLYLGIALLTSGGLGAGDVKLGGLLGLALGWLGWSELIVGTMLGWLAAALGWFVLRASGRLTRDSTLPLGPFLLLGALLVVSLPV